MSRAAGPFAWVLAAGLRAVAIVGICKNAGKTTLLNHLLSLRPNGCWGVFSTGIDGEERDTVFHVPKPAVKLGPDTIFCCDTPTLDSLGSSVAILERLGGGSSARELWLARSQMPLQTVITGPGSVTEQIKALDRMRVLGADKVLIDGSLDRKSIALDAAVNAVVVLIGASFGSIASIISEVRRLELLNALPEAGGKAAERALLLKSRQIMLRRDKAWQQTKLNSLLGNEQALVKLLEGGAEELFIPGALTEATLRRLREPLAAAGVAIRFRHPECLKLGLSRLERFVEEFNPGTLLPFRIRAWALNSAAVGAQAVDAAEFRAKLRKAFPRLDLPDIRELQP